jgi:poly [ADP-ribose] polymerase
MRLWHGTKSSNCLSILKAGMMIPPASSSHVCGRAYGNGLYFSDQSTKSIRYATGAWTGGGRTDRKFMFLVDVAMGKMHTPTSVAPGSSYKPPQGHDSCFARAGVSGVQNNEMIVFSLTQANPVFLCEFTPYGK